MREMRVSSGGLAGTLAHLTCTRIPPTKLRERPASSSTERWGCTATHTVTVPLAGNGTSSARCIHPSSANTKTCFARFDVTVSTRGSPDRFEMRKGTTPQPLPIPAPPPPSAVTRLQARVGRRELDVAQAERELWMFRDEVREM